MGTTERVNQTGANWIYGHCSDLEDTFDGGDSGIQNGRCDELCGTAADVFVFHDEPVIEGIGFCFLLIEAAGGFKSRQRHEVRIFLIGVGNRNIR